MINFDTYQKEALERAVKNTLSSEFNTLSREELLKRLPRPNLMSMLTSEQERKYYVPNKYWYKDTHPVNSGITLTWANEVKDDIEISVKVNLPLMNNVTKYQGGIPEFLTDEKPALYYDTTNSYMYTRDDPSNLTTKFVQPAMDAVEAGTREPTIRIYLHPQFNSKPLSLTITPGEVSDNRIPIGGGGCYTSIDARPTNDDSGDIILYCSTNNFEFNYHDFVVSLHNPHYRLIDHLSFF